jgi:hypothetical protein
MLLIFLVSSGTGKCFVCASGSLREEKRLKSAELNEIQ